MDSIQPLFGGPAAVVEAGAWQVSTVALQQLCVQQASSYKLHVRDALTANN